VGVKWENPARTVRINGAFFYSDYENIQVRVLDQVAPGVGNAGKGEVYGGEIELYAVPTEQLTLTAGLAYLDTEITELGADIDPDLDRITIGNSFVNSPEWTINASGSYTFPVSNIADLTLRLDWSWKDRNYNNWANDVEISQESFHLLNASGTFAFNDAWELVLAARNLTDETYIVTGNYELDSFGYIEAIYAREREWSLSLKYSF